MTARDAVDTEVAFRTVLVYAQYAGLESRPGAADADMETAIRGLVRDLQHLADEYGCDWADLVTEEAESDEAERMWRNLQAQIKEKDRRGN